HLIDLRSSNEYWNLGSKLDDKANFYCGPGLWYDGKTGRLHVRLAHNTLPQLGEDGYHGETDPRKLPLAVAAPREPPLFAGARHVRIQDLAVRGGSKATVSMTGAQDIALEGVTAYGGSPALFMRGCERVRIFDCAIRGISAPWSSRAGHKYRGVPAYLIT